MNDERSIQRVMSGESWNEFCDGLKAAGAVILREASPRDPLDRAEGFRYLTRLARTALEQQLEFADPAAPAFRRPSHETIKIGADNPDNHYQSAAISGAYEYVIRGRRNSVHYLGIGTYAGGYGSSARSGQTGYIDDATLAVGAGRALRDRGVVREAAGQLAADGARLEHADRAADVSEPRGRADRGPRDRARRRGRPAGGPRARRARPRARGGGRIRARLRHAFHRVGAAVSKSA